MARFVDLDDADPEEGEGAVEALRDTIGNAVGDRFAAGDAQSSDGTELLPQSTFENVATRAFQCYPIVIAVVSWLDLNTLDALARTSRRVHHSLVQYRATLLRATLRCAHEGQPVDRGETLRFRARAGNWYYMEDGRSYSGKAGDCARDMVGQCRRCGDVVCRNCAIKPPAPIAQRDRHRRLCKGCVCAPIATLVKPPLDASTPPSADAVQRAVCTCATEGVWLCQPCGRSIRAADGDYKRIWRWRSHYGEVLGGLGTGIGDGDRGVICGREADCCAAKEREQEIDCDAEDAKEAIAAPWIADLPFASSATSSNARTPSPSAQQYQQQQQQPPLPPLFASAAPIDALIGDEARRTPSPSQQQHGPGYERHEIEGIGGVVKRKLVRMVRVGACVPEGSDERVAGGRGALRREVRGDVRSWCGWCWRVVPGAEDVAGSAGR